ncbi:S-adenosyl-L-methionine-dependent methyltransferase [Xylaria venustula]|nr:S-adenosyl-L-methionine-dependent methyltransferase [Xylaria venustula]
MENVYRHGTGTNVGYSDLSSYVGSLAHKHTDLVILEVGAGTGGVTKPVLDASIRHGNSGIGAGRFERYDFTDISPSFFNTAKDTYKATAGRMRFRILNIENDPSNQGFELDQYGVIIAGNVAHGPMPQRISTHSLKNLWKLLKPGGKLVLHGFTNHSMLILDEGPASQNPNGEMCVCGGSSAARLNKDKFKNSIRLEFVDISYLAKNKGQKFSAILDTLMRLVSAGDVRPLYPTQVFTFGDMREAFRYMQAGAHSGKIVMELHADDIVPAVTKTNNSYIFKEDASFVIQGPMWT